MGLCPTSSASVVLAVRHKGWAPLHLYIVAPPLLFADVVLMLPRLLTHV